MRNTIYNRIRLIGILLCLALIAAAMIPACAFAAEQSAVVEQDSVHFINPTDITIVGDYLYVADIVEDNKTAILCFEAGERNPEPKYTYELPIEFAVKGLSASDDTIYAFDDTTVLELRLRDGSLPTIGSSYSLPAETTDVIIDVAYGQLPMNPERHLLYALTKTSVLQYVDNGFVPFARLSEFTNTAGLLAAEINSVPYLYYLHDSTCERYNLKINNNDEGFAKLNLSSGFVPSGIFKLGEKVELYNSSEIYEIVESQLHIDTIRLLSLNELYGSDCKIIDVEAYGERLFVLNSRNQIDVFDKGEASYDTVNYATIGSDMVDKKTPTQYTSFTLVRPKGYPANIIFKTNDSKNSITEIITDASEYIILGYDGDETSHYYYVLAGDKFGWVKKSDFATCPANDGKLTIVDNNKGNETFAAEAKFTSLNAVYVYKLPLESSESVTVNQSASSMKTVKVLQEYKEKDIIWYYVSYDEGKTGFVKKSDVGQIHFVAKSKPSFIGPKKINSSLFAPVDLYATADMADGDFVADADGNTLKLYSGDRVSLVKTEGDAAFIMILHDNGNEDYGWIPADKLIERHQITTNAIVGLSLLAAAIAITTVLLIVYFKRKRKIKRNAD